MGKASTNFGNVTGFNIWRWSAGCAAGIKCVAELACVSGPVCVAEDWPAKPSVALEMIPPAAAALPAARANARNCLRVLDICTCSWKSGRSPPVLYGAPTSQVYYNCGAHAEHQPAAFTSLSGKIWQGPCAAL
jgi:hypothetical protein